MKKGKIFSKFFPNCAFYGLDMVPEQEQEQEPELEPEP